MDNFINLNILLFSGQLANLSQMIFVTVLLYPSYLIQLTGS
jgi:hypothetical protein